MLITGVGATLFGSLTLEYLIPARLASLSKDCFGWRPAVRDLWSR
jgi:hypothetical protein